MLMYLRLPIVAVFLFLSCLPVRSEEVAPESDYTEFQRMERLMRDALKDPAITDSQRNYIESSLALILKHNGFGGAEPDSLICAAWKSELSMPLEQRNYQTFQSIVGYHILSANKPAILEATRMMEQVRGNRAVVIDNDYFSYRSLLVSAYQQGGDLVSARRIVLDDIARIGSAVGVEASPELLNYLWNCYRFLDRENSVDKEGITYCALLILKSTQSYVAAVGPENADLSLIAPMKEILMHPLFVRYVDISEIKGMYAQMEELFKRKTLSKGDRIAYVRLLVQKAYFLLHEHDDVAEAERCAERALDIADNDWDRMRAYSCMMSIYLSKGDMEKVSQYFPLVSRYARQTGEDDYFFRKIEAIYEAAQCLKNNDAEGAVGAAEKCYFIMREEWTNRLPHMTSIDRENFIARNGDPVHLLSQLLERWPEKVAGKVYDGVLYRTGMQLRAQKAMAEAIMESKNPMVRNYCDTLALMRNVYNRMDMLDEGAMQLNIKIRNIEHKIVDMVSSDKGPVNNLHDWRSVRDCLKDGEAAVELVFSRSMLMALVVKPGVEAPIAVALTPTRKFTYFMVSRHARSTAELARKLYAKDSSVLYEMLWQPLDPVLAGVSKVYLSVPGALNGISFNALSTSEGKCLFDLYDIHQLTSTGYLVEKHSSDTPRNALVVGNVDFSGAGGDARSGEPLPDEADRYVAIDDFSDRGVARRHFSQLPFTDVETDSVASLLSDARVRRLSGAGASEKNLRKELGRIPDLLHLATHGFFIGNVRDALKVPYMRLHRQSVASSMQRAGVALAGAEQTWGGKNLPDSVDGILTALEVADMNLKGVKLVTLSACETALGDYTFEGVYGLPRGFKQAGAESLLVSLWSVNDKSTSMFMTEFYRRWLSGTDRHEAYRKAMDKVRGKYPDAFYWSSFILLD